MDMPPLNVFMTIISREKMLLKLRRAVFFGLEKILRRAKSIFDLMLYVSNTAGLIKADENQSPYAIMIYE